MTEKKQDVRDRFIGTAYLLRTDRTRYQELINRLMNITTVGSENEYPVSLGNAIQILDEFRGTNAPTGAGSGDVMIFAQSSEAITTSTKGSTECLGLVGLIHSKLQSLD